MDELWWRSLAKAMGREWLGAAAGKVRLRGGASARTYWRVMRPGGGSVVVATEPLGSAAEHGDTTAGSRPMARWLAERDRLAAVGLPVPEVLSAPVLMEAFGCEALLLEDLGDERLYERATQGAVAERLALYEEAVALLARFQRATAALESPRRLGREPILAELDEFRENGLEHRHGIRLNPLQRRTWDASVALIVEQVSGLPVRYAHRDFQSQNLMWTPRGPVIIDFQDSFAAPAAYDWVALLRDSYVDLGRETVEQLLVSADPEVRASFGWVTVQRKLKDAGRFVTIARRGDPSFLQWYGQSMRYVRDAIQALEALKPLGDLLSELVTELRVPGER